MSRRRTIRTMQGGRKRFISTRISTDPQVNQLIDMEGYYAALLYTWLIPHADKDGYLPSDDPEEVFYIVTPGAARNHDVSEARRAIAVMVELGLLECRSDGIAFPAREFRRFKSGNASPERRAWERVARFVRPGILERDGYRCLLCGSDGPLEVDHKTPLSRGGSNEETNLQTLCRECNRRKWAN
jgi:hypothetical protein